MNKVAVVAMALAATLSGTRASGESPTPGPTGDVERLGTDAVTLLQKVEQLRAELARLTRERDELAKEVAEARVALAKLKTETQRTPTQESVPRDSVAGAAEDAEMVGPKRPRPGAQPGARNPVEASVARGAENPLLAVVRGGTSFEKPSAGTDPFPVTDASANERPTKGEPESRARIEKLEAELREVRRREEAVQADARGLEQALEAQRRSTQSKLEALESVLLDARSASARLREELAETRQRNTDLSNRASMLDATSQDAQPSNTPDRRQLAATEQNRTSGSPPSPANDPGVAGNEGSVESPAIASEDPSAAKDLREQLSVERERRETLEEEVKRLTTSGNSDERLTEVWNALQSARSEILVLSNQLAEEKKDREDLEVALARAQQDPANKSNTDLAQRLAKALNDRRSEADRLAAQLKDANEIIVRLKGRLEASGSPEAADNLIVELQKDNETLRGALKAAEQANQALRGKAEMAQRLAEMVYGKGP